ncbi:lactate utilization protein [Irregularibacter muris]|uniref:Lactate utilization protein n=1 Tax=Irregularibacter muris TaxID=1796619 RepID=A0AAE3KZX4_9FIRM|nr:lactate utilization protein [Irregularibacter muris]MCR1899326.1 lactate utilization protein [Irregularibacter muris]
MDSNLQFVRSKKVERTLKNLEKNNMKGYYVQDEKEALEKIRSLLKEGDVVSVGGSATLSEIGALDILKKGEYEYLDRYAPELTPKEIKDIYRKSFFADAYLTSSNAITEQGELYNVDGRGNRVAAMIYGPDKVIVVAGINKIVKNVEEAVERNKSISGPANNKRLNKTTPCTKTGYCGDCHSADRICNEYVLIKRQLEADRIHVILVNQELGY